MNIFYNNNTLYINLEDEINEYSMNKLRSRVFKIVRDYEIDDVILKVDSYKKDNYLLKNFLNDFERNFGGHIKVKWFWPFWFLNNKKH